MRHSELAHLAQGRRWPVAKRRVGRYPKAFRQMAVDWPPSALGGGYHLSSSARRVRLPRGHSRWILTQGGTVPASDRRRWGSTNWRSSVSNLENFTKLLKTLVEWLKRCL